MNLLLTSAGLSNKPIADALLELAGKQPQELKVAFVPTAANVETGDKGWLIKDLVDFKNRGFISVDIIDISALPKDIWQPRIEEADVLCFGGGNTFHLMYWIKKSELQEILPDLLKTRVYMGISAGSMVTSNSFSLSQSQRLYSKAMSEQKDDLGLGFVDFQILPHLNSPDFPSVRKESLKQRVSKIKNKIYAIDDQSAIAVRNGAVRIVGNGEWIIFNES